MILFRLTCIPLAVLGFLGGLLSFLGAPCDFVLSWIIGGLIALVFCIGFMWAITNLFTFLYCPRYYWLWRRGGGDPYFDSMPEPFNMDDDLVRYQELYAERARQQAEMFNPPPPAPPDPPDDPTANIQI